MSAVNSMMISMSILSVDPLSLLLCLMRNHLLENSRNSIYGGKMMALSITYFALTLGLSSLSSATSMVLWSQLRVMSSIFYVRCMVAVTTVLQGELKDQLIALHCGTTRYFVHNLPDDEAYHHICIAVSSGFTQDPPYYPSFESLVHEVHTPSYYRSLFSASGIDCFSCCAIFTTSSFALEHLHELQCFWSL